MVRTPRFHCRSPGFNPWWGNQNPASCAAQPKKKITGQKKPYMTHGSLNAQKQQKSFHLKLRQVRKHRGQSLVTSRKENGWLGNHHGRLTVTRCHHTTVQIVNILSFTGNILSLCTFFFPLQPFKNIKPGMD